MGVALMVEYEVTEKRGERVTLHLRGRMAVDGVPDEEVLKKSLETHYIDDGVKEIRVNLSDLEEISLEGVAVLVALYKESAARGKRFVGEGARGQVREKLLITGMLGPLEALEP
jgi:anti-anti-sigma regulatory factor